MYEIAYRDLLLDLVVVAFDGRVVEVFTSRDKSQSFRMHVSLVDVTVDGPHRKGYYDVQLVRSLRVGEPDWPQMEAMLHQVRGSRQTWERPS